MFASFRLDRHQAAVPAVCQVIEDVAPAEPGEALGPVEAEEMGAFLYMWGHSEKGWFGPASLEHKVS